MQDKLNKENIVNKNSWVLLKQLFSKLRPYAGAFGLSIIGVLIASAAEAVIYKYVVPPLFDKGLIEKSSTFLKLAPFYILFTFMLRGIGDFIGKFFMAYVGRNIVKDHRIAMLAKLLYLPVPFFDATNSGSLIAKINYDAEQVAVALSDAILELLKGLATIIFLLAVMFSISWQVTIALLIILPIISSYLKAISKRLRRYSSRVQDSMGEITDLAQEIINAHKVIRAFAGMSSEKLRIDKIIGNNCKQEVKVALVMAVSEPIMQLIGACALASLIYLATLQNLHISPGQFIGLFGAMFGLIRPIKQITQINNVLQKGLAAAASIYNLLEQENEIDAGQYKCNSIKGDICFEQVSFSYLPYGQHKTGTIALKNISFHIKPGETVAVVGSSGGGKSTLVSLLPRFYDIKEGNILLDNINLKDFNLAFLREQIAIVTQQVVLFNDTIANNIAYGKTTTTSRQAIIEAARAAYVLDFSEKLPAGLDTVIGQDGIILSGGQRQRLAIARAILKNAPILILDEATSALDNESERYIQAALANIMQHCTTLVIAHRLSTIEQADKILVLEHGKIVEFGSHTELMANNARYAKLKKLQFSNATS